LTVILCTVDTAHIYGFGYSFGGAVVCALAERRELRALILLSTFTSLYDMAIANGLPPFLVLDPFNNFEVVKHYSFFYKTKHEFCQ